MTMTCMSAGQRKGLERSSRSRHRESRYRGTEFPIEPTDGHRLILSDSAQANADGRPLPGSGLRLVLSRGWTELPILGSRRFGAGGN
jgi:hypothetical protein